MYIDYLLKFADKTEADAALYDGEMPKYAAIDVIGVIERDGVAVPGWHVNVRHNATAPELDAYAVTPTPTTPERVWL